MFGNICAKIMPVKKICGMFSAAVFAAFAILPLGASADSDGGDAEIFTQPRAASACLYEARSGNMLYEFNADEPRPAGHLAKLMTALICAEECADGRLKMSDKATASANANSKQGAQIWLDAGEKITVEELLKSIIIGNANDACTALAEHISGGEGDHVSRMNRRADLLGMDSTRFADVTGESEETVTTAADIALLAAELSRHTELDGLFTTRIDSVRGGKAELVSGNRLILSYKGIRGTKACGGSGSGECLVACAERNGMTLCAVVLGAEDEQCKLSDAAALLDSGFANFRLYEPEVAREYLLPIALTGGCAAKLKVHAEVPEPAIIRAGSAGSVEVAPEIPEQLEAPVKKDAPVGRVVYTLDGKELLTVEIQANETVERMNMRFALKTALLKLLNI